MFPDVSGSEGSKELPVSLATLHPLFYKWTLGGSTLLTPPVADTKSIGHIHSKRITLLHNFCNVTHHTHSV